MNSEPVCFFGKNSSWMCCFRFIFVSGYFMKYLHFCMHVLIIVWFIRFRILPTASLSDLFRFQLYPLSRSLAQSHKLASPALYMFQSYGDDHSPVPRLFALTFFRTL